MSGENRAKACTECNVFKSYSEFYKDGRASSGVKSRCKSCDLAYIKAYRNSKGGREIERESQARHRATEAGKESAARRYKKFISTDKGRASRCSSAHKYIMKNEIKVSARVKVAKALKAGELVRGGL